MGDTLGETQWVYCGQFGRPHGVHGAVRLWPHNPQTNLLKSGAQLCVTRPLKPDQSRDLISLPESAIQTYTITHARRDTKGWVVSLKEFSSREQAQAINLHEWVARRGDFPALAEDEFYFSDLIGAQGVLDDGRSIGALTEVIEAGAGEILIFEGTGDGEVMVPFVWDTFILKVDLEAKRVVIRAVKGLLEGGV